MPRPSEIYPNVTKEQFRKYLRGYKPLAFRVPKHEEYFAATMHEMAVDKISSGTKFVSYICYPGWSPTTPRFIIPKELWSRSDELEHT